MIEKDKIKYAIVIILQGITILIITFIYLKGLIITGIITREELSQSEFTSTMFLASGAVVGAFFSGVIFTLLDPLAINVRKDEGKTE